MIGRNGISLVLLFSANFPVAEDDIKNIQGGRKNENG
jgi:hypothetical protein